MKYNSYALMAALRLDPLSLKALDDLRGQVLNDMKGEELSEGADRLRRFSGAQPEQLRHEQDARFQDREQQHQLSFY